MNISSAVLYTVMFYEIVIQKSCFQKFKNRSLMIKVNRHLSLFVKLGGEKDSTGWSQCCPEARITSLTHVNQDGC